jgi:hypothetical protein
MKEGTSNLGLLFFSWWYGYLPRRLYLAFLAAMISLFDRFSVKVLLATWFSPWKRDIISTDGLTLQQKFQVFMLNLASRVIGFLAKTSVLISFAILFVVTVSISVALFALWLAFPITVLILLIFGLVNLNGTSY